MWLLTKSVNGSNAVAPVDAQAPETAASLEGLYRETSPAREITTCDAHDHQDAWAARRAKRARGSPGSGHGFGSGARGRAGLILHALGLSRPPGIVRGACEGGVNRMTLQGGQSSQSQLRVAEQRQRTVYNVLLRGRGTHETLRREVERSNR